MKKLLALLCAAALLCLAACGPVSAGETGNPAAPSGAAPASPDAAALAVLTTGRMNCATEEGYYYLSEAGFRLEDGGYGYPLMYLDYGSQREIFLCSRPGCSHDTLECPAVFSQEAANLGGSLFVYDGALYLFSHDQDQDGGAQVQSGDSGSTMQEGSAAVSGDPARLYRMNLDGTDRRQVLSFDAGLTLEDLVLGGEGELFFITKKLSVERLDNRTAFFTSAERTLVRVDSTSWELKPVCALESGWEVEGVWEDQLVLSQIVFEHELTEEERLDERAYLSAYRNSETRLFLFRPGDGEREQLLTLKNQRLNSFAVHGGALYSSTQGENAVRRLDLTTGEEIVLAQVESNMIFSALQDALLCTSWDGSDTALTFLHYGDGAADRANLVTSSVGTPIELMAEQEDTFLIIYDVDAKRDTAYQNGQYSVRGYKYALIGKEDLYAGRANYRKIEMIGFGR